MPMSVRKEQPRSFRAHPIYTETLLMSLLMFPRHLEDLALLLRACLDCSYFWSPEHIPKERVVTALRRSLDLQEAKYRGQWTGSSSSENDSVNSRVDLPNERERRENEGRIDGR